MNHEINEDNFDEFAHVPPYPADWVYIPGVNDDELARRVLEAHERVKNGEYVDHETVMRKLEEILGG